MFVNICSIIALVCEVIVSIVYVKESIKNKVVVSKKTIGYYIPVLFIVIFLYLCGAYYSKGKLPFEVIIKSIGGGITSFAYKIEESYIQKASEDFILFRASFHFSYLLAAFTVFGGFIGIVRQNADNLFQVKTKLKTGADIIIGYNDVSLNYAKRNNSIIWIDNTIQKLSKDDKNKLYKMGICYYEKKITKDVIEKTLISNKYHFICFEDGNTIPYVKYIEIFRGLEFDASKNITIHLHLEASQEYLEFINDRILNKEKNCNQNVIISCFNLYELIAQKHANDTSLLTYLPNNYIKNCLLKEGKDINVCFVGFGKTNTALLKSSIINNQFVGLKNGKYYNHRVNYYLFDGSEKAFSKNIINRLSEDYYSKEGENNKSKLEKICNINYKTLDVKGNNLLVELSQIVNTSSFTYIYVGFSNSFQNAYLGENIFFNLRRFKKNIKVFVNIDSEDEIGVENIYKDILAYGFKNQILTHDVIANESLTSLARLINDEYAGLTEEEKIRKYESQVLIEKYSNEYHALNLRFKLNLLGLDYKKDVNGIDENEYYKIYSSFNSLEEYNKFKDNHKYKEYFLITKRNTLIFQEHLRWVALYFLSMVDPMPFSEIYCTEKEIDGDKKIKFVGKKLDEKMHACVRSFVGVDKYHYKLLKLYNEKGENKTINDVETFKYDAMGLDNAYKFLNSISYAIVKKEN